MATGPPLPETGVISAFFTGLGAGTPTAVSSWRFAVNADLKAAAKGARVNGSVQPDAEGKVAIRPAPVTEDDPGRLPSDPPAELYAFARPSSLAWV